MDDFVRCALLLASPGTPPAQRAQADVWLAAFRGNPAAWGVALGVLRSAAAPEARLQAGSLLAWKAKRQLAQLQQQQQQELAEALTELAAAAAPGDVAARGVLLALANMAIHCSGWARPLDTLGPRLSRERMLEFLTLLPQECEDAVAAALGMPAEVGWALKARGHEWGPQVAAWLHALHTGVGGAGSPGGGPPSPQQGQQQQGEWERLTLAVLRCFTAWVKCLQHVQPAHAAYFASLAAELLFAPDPAAGLPHLPACLPTAVEAVCEVLEHADEALAPLLLRVASALPARAAALQAAGFPAAAEELAHVFALFVGTHAPLCSEAGPRGAALRQGLLQLLSLPMQLGGDGDAALPVLGALSDLLEHLAAARRRPGGACGGQQRQQGGGAPPGIEAGEAAAFAAAALDVLLAQLQPLAAAFQAGPPLPQGGARRGAPSPEGVPDVFRREAAALLDTAGDLMGPEAAVAAVAAHTQRAVASHGVPSLQACAALDASLFVLEGLGGLLESSDCERATQGPPPPWLEGFVRLYSLVPVVDGAGGQAAASSLPPLTILHADFLSGFAGLGPVVLPLLRAANQQHLQAVTGLVLGLALRALSDAPRSADVAAGAGDDVGERAAVALRTLCGCATACGMETTPQLLAALEDGMRALQGQQQGPQQEAACQLVAALVHALHGVPAGDAATQAQAQAAVARLVLDPLAAALMRARQAVEAAVPQQRARAALARLHAALRQLHALLNGLESYLWSDDGGGGSSGGGAGGARQGHEAARAAAAAMLAAWPQLAAVCCWRAPPGASLEGVHREVVQELAYCLSSWMVLDGTAFQQALPSFAATVAACWHHPGGSALVRPLVQAVEAYGPPYQQPLLATAAAMLASPPGRALAAARGADTNPESAQALLSLLACCLRQAAQWRALAPGSAAELEAVLGLGLLLAVAAAAAHHRDASLAAVAALSALLALLLEQASPLHGELLGFAARQGPALLRGLLLALLSLNSASHLPKVVSLMSDTALLAATLALAEQQQPHRGGGQPSQEAVCGAAAALLGGWLATARQEVARSGALPEGALAALLERWDWRPALEQAAAQVTQQRGSGRGAAEARRALQRSVRQLAELARRGGGHAAVAAA